MSDDPDAPRVITAPLAAANARPATQMSAASAVPSTVDSPQHPSTSPPRAAAAAGSPDEIRADAIDAGATTRDNAARDAALAEAGAPASTRRMGPATMMSPAVAAPGPGPSTPPLAPEQAVIDVGAPAHAFVPHGNAAHAGSSGHSMMHHGAPGVGGHRRGMSTTAMVLIVVGLVAGVSLLVVAAGVYLFFERAQERRTEQSPRSQRSRSAAPDPPERMGGRRARGVSVTSSGGLDQETVRTIVVAALPRLDVCFAATELEPPNHEVATYELDVAPSGEVRRAEPSQGLERTPRLDACVVQGLRALRMPRQSKACTVKLTLTASLD